MFLYVYISFSNQSIKVLKLFNKHNTLVKHYLLEFSVIKISIDLKNEKM